MESVSTGQTEFSFRLRTNVDGAYGYQVVKRTQNDGIEKPDAASLFDEHTGTVNKETTVAVTGLETGCSYVLYAAVKAETLYSEVAEARLYDRGELERNYRGVGHRLRPVYVLYPL